VTVAVGQRANQTHGDDNDQQHDLWDPPLARSLA
jgi:hypothetical protein